MSPHPEALGALDELNSVVGIAYAIAKNTKKKFALSKLSMKEVLLETLHHIFVVQAEVAGADKTLFKKDVVFLENITDIAEKIMPPIKSFTIPGATVLSAHLDHARTLARRAERRVCALPKNKKPSKETLQYMNRLSSVFFALARFSAFKEGVKEEKPHY